MQTLALKSFLHDATARTDLRESAKVSHKRAFALLRGEKPQLEMAKVRQKPVFALPGCQQISMNPLLCDTLGLAESLSRYFRKMKPSVQPVHSALRLYTFSAPPFYRDFQPEMSWRMREQKCAIKREQTA